MFIIFWLKWDGEEKILMYEFIRFTAVATTTAIEAWVNSPLLPDLHHKRHIIQTETAWKNNEQILKKQLHKIIYMNYNFSQLLFQFCKSKSDGEKCIEINKLGNVW